MLNKEMSQNFFLPWSTDLLQVFLLLIHNCLMSAKQEFDDLQAGFFQTDLWITIAYKTYSYPNRTTDEKKKHFLGELDA